MKFLLEIYSDPIPVFTVKELQERFPWKNLGASSDRVIISFNQDTQDELALGKTLLDHLKSFRWSHNKLHFSFWPRVIHQINLYTPKGVINLFTGKYKTNETNVYNVQWENIEFNLEKKCSLLDKLSIPLLNSPEQMEIIKNQLIIADFPQFLSIELDNYRLPVEIIKHILFNEYLCLLGQDSNNKLWAIYLLTVHLNAFIEASVKQSLSAKLIEAEIYFSNDIQRSYVLNPSPEITCKQLMFQHITGQEDNNLFLQESAVLQQSKIVEEYKEMIGIMLEEIFKLDRKFLLDPKKLLVDKLFSLIRLVSEGKTFSATSDPFAMKSTIDSILSIIYVNDISFDTNHLLDIYFNCFPGVRININNCFMERIKHCIKINPQAVLQKPENICDFLAMVKELVANKQLILRGYKRLSGIVEEQYDCNLDYSFPIITNFIETGKNLVGTMQELEKILDSYKIKENKNLQMLLSKLKVAIESYWDIKNLFIK